MQKRSYNHFAAIYYLLVERLKEYRLAQPARPGPALQQRPRSTDLSGFEVRGQQVPLIPPPRVFALDCVPKLGVPLSDTSRRGCRLSPEVRFPHPLGTGRGSRVSWQTA